MSSLTILNPSHIFSRQNLRTEGPFFTKKEKGRGGVRCERSHTTQGPSLGHSPAQNWSVAPQCHSIEFKTLILTFKLLHNRASVFLHNHHFCIPPSQRGLRTVPQQEAFPSLLAPGKPTWKALSTLFKVCVFRVHLKCHVKHETHIRGTSLLLL